MSPGRYRELHDFAPIAYLSLDGTGGIRDANPAATRLLGVRRAELIGQTLGGFVHPADAATYRRVLRAALKRPGQLIVRLRLIDHRLLHVRLETRGSRPGSDGLHVVMVDETERVLAQADLRDSEARMRAIVETAHDGIVVTSAGGRVEICNAAAQRMFGQTAREMLGRPLARMIRGANAFLRTAADPGPGKGASRRQDRELIGRRRDGSSFPLHVAVSAVRFGTERKLVATLQDISKRRLAEANLRASEEFSRATIDALTAPLCVLDGSGRIIAVNRAWRQTALAQGASARVASGKANYLQVCESARGRDRRGTIEMARAIRSLLQNRTTEFSQEYSCDGPEGTRWFVAHGTALRSDGRRHCVIVHEEITAHKKAEQALHERIALQAQLEKLASAVPGALYSFRRDRKGRTHAPYASPGIEAIYGLRPQDVAQDDTPFWERIHPADRDRLAADLLASAGSLSTWQGEWRVLNPTKGELWVEGRAEPERQPDGSIVWFGFIHDITGRKRLEASVRESESRYRELSARLQSAIEEERRSIARELHDELGAQLTRVRMDASWLRRAADDPAERARQLAQLERDIDATIASVRRLATSLRPSLLDHGGLDAVIQHYVAEFQRRTGILCRTRLAEVSADIDARAATTIFRILQESLTNVARHADASRVHVALRPVGSLIELRIADDGKGMPAARGDGPSSLGLLGMAERARSVGGALLVRPARPKGTEVLLSMPRSLPAAVAAPASNPTSEDRPRSPSAERPASRRVDARAAQKAAGPRRASPAHGRRTPGHA